jgi:adenosylhomocysteine nucleosidase
MPRELRPLVRALGLRRTELAGRPAWSGPTVVAVTIGVGPQVARRSAARLLEACEPAGVLVIGVAGACDPRLRVGDVVNPARVVDAADGAAYEPDTFLLSPPSPASSATGTTARAGILVTVERFGATPPPGADAVDMETAAVAAECVARGVPWDVRRAVSDTPGGVPEAAGTLLRADGRADIGAVVRLLARHPAEAITLAKLGRDTGRAISAVTAVAVALLGARL